MGTSIAAIERITMVRSPETSRPHDSAEAAFTILRVLQCAHVLWADGGELPVEVVTGLAGAPRAALAGVLAQMVSEGAIEFCAGDSVRLSAETLRALR